MQIMKKTDWKEIVGEFGEKFEANKMSGNDVLALREDCEGLNLERARIEVWCQLSSYDSHHFDDLKTLEEVKDSGRL